MSSVVYLNVAAIKANEARWQDLHFLTHHLDKPFWRSLSRPSVTRTCDQWPEALCNHAYPRAWSQHQRRGARIIKEPVLFQTDTMSMVQRGVRTPQPEARSLAVFDMIERLTTAHIQLLEHMDSGADFEPYLQNRWNC